MKIKDIDNPELFQRLVHAILQAEYGNDFQVVDDSGGDLGNDGYLRSQKALYAIYCPEKKPTQKTYKKKINKDFQKAVRLRDSSGYAIGQWVFVTPTDLREPIQRYVRDEASKFGIIGICLGDTYLTDLYLRHEHLHNRFMDLDSPRIYDELSIIREGIDKVLNVVSTGNIKKEQMEVSNLSSYSLLRFMPNAHLLSIKDMLFSGAINEGLAKLEQLRLETSDEGERLWAILLAVQFTDKVRNPDLVFALTEEGIALAERLREPSALSILKAERGWLINYQFVNLDMHTYQEINMSNVTGISFINNKRKKSIERQLEILLKDSDKLFDDAYTTAFENRRYRELCFVLQMKASALSQRDIFHQRVPPLLNKVIEERKQIRLLYETAIRIATSLGDIHSLANAYHNYANDLIMFGDVGRAYTHATRANQLAKSYGISYTEEKSAELIKIIEKLRNKNKDCT